MLMTDLREVKAYLDIPSTNTVQDLALSFYIEVASSWLEELMGRQGFLEKKSRTEYYSGTGSQNLLLRARPVYTTPTIVANIDREGFFNASGDAFDSADNIVYGDGLTLVIDQDDGTSRCGILVRTNGFWPKPRVGQQGYLSSFLGNGYGNIKVTYTGGYTVDTLPSFMRLACNILVAKLNNLFPLGMELTSESYEERHQAYLPHKKMLLDTIKPMIFSMRNWKW